MTLLLVSVEFVPQQIARRCGVIPVRLPEVSARMHVDEMPPQWRRPQWRWLLACFSIASLLHGLFTSAMAPVIAVRRLSQM